MATQIRIFFKEVVINGSRHLAYVDLGSECLLITRELAENLRLPVTMLREKVKLMTFSTDKFVIPQHVTCTLLTLDGIEKKVEMYIVLTKIMNVDILIGQNFTELPDVCTVYQTR